MRDFQRSKVYRWERSHLPSGKFLQFNEIEEYVKKIWEKMELQYPPKVDMLPANTKNAAGDATREEVRFKENGATEKVVLHELAHAMTADIEGQSHQHNEIFVGMFMVLLERFLGVEKFVLWYTAQKEGVKFEMFSKPRITDDGTFYR